jgi:2-hydroxychromene-2-carboxylate isomerase
MARRIRFHYDPLCPWAWQSSKWIREVEKARDVEVEWRLFSLWVTNDKPESLSDPEARGSAALRTLALVSKEEGNEAAGALYKAVGERVHDAKEEFTADLVRKSLVDVGLNESFVDRALTDKGTIDAVLADHKLAAEQAGAFGVPTIVLPSGKGIFGPVVSIASTGEEAGEMWDHVSWLAEREEFFELKRERDRNPGG